MKKFIVTAAVITTRQYTIEADTEAQAKAIVVITPSIEADSVTMFDPEVILVETVDG